ncbi:Z1 domain-containing protein [Micromonospora sp. LOL_027]|uniref:Z1 domain-containing protein n=1 Tax=Micromonospora sp. LOL_027 TaxID=3345419 RepID=UPI003A856D87
MSAVAPDNRDNLEQAVRLVLAMLPQDRQAATAEIDSALDLICAMQQARGEALDRTELAREIQSRVAVWQDDAVGLSDPRGHVEWLAEARGDRGWEFWKRYRRFLEDVRTMPPRVVRQIDQSTDRVLRQLEDPRRPGRWRRTGMVVGQVQSGKTGNYIGLAAKAADAGYKLIVILAGIHNSLRSQTQLRVDEGLLGFDTQYQQRSDEETKSSRIGVGAMPAAPRLPIASLTNSAEKGDFRRNVASNLNLPIGDYPVVLVIKKHRSILEYVRRWMVEVEGEGAGADKIVRNVPLLVIDDEADHASVDTTKEEETDPSAVNAAIRRLMNSFDKAAYVGYTATPFANIYISSTSEHHTLGPDLFPESFIESLASPSNYLGPERVFGLRADDPDDTNVEQLPIYREISDSDSWIPARHKKEWSPSEDLPASLRRAVNSFILICAARRARGQSTAHNSMLVHVTRYLQVQAQVRDQLDEHVGLIRDRLRDSMGAEADRMLAELRALWEEDFVPTTDAFPTDEAPRLTWESVAAQIPSALGKIEVRAVNGTSRDTLEYYEHRRTGISVIAVGGDKLSRGLTLEGLSVSYYLRASNTYDTLLQMGRWFGYRPNYEDLCRLYTSDELRRAYVEITAADHELRRDFEEMAALGQTPENFGLRVRASSAGLAVTAANKMRRGVKVRLSYSGELPETTIFDIREDSLRRNLTNLDAFVSAIEHRYGGRTVGGSVVWEGVPPADIIEGFLDGYVPDRRSYRVRPAFISQYIRRCMASKELSDWTVRLVGTSAGRKVKIGTAEVGLVKRAHREIVDDRYTIRRVLSPMDESSDLDPQQRARALESTRLVRRRKAERSGKPYVETDVPTGRPLREVRSVDQPLLLIYPILNPVQADGVPVVGFAISFPFSGHPSDTEYVVNEIWRQQEIDELDPEDGVESQ